MSFQALLAMALALGVGGLVKGATGMGLPIVALPILASFLGVQHAVAVMCFPLLITNLWQVWRYRADMWSAEFLPRLLAGGAIGIALGTALIAVLPERTLSLTLASCVFAYVGLRLSSPQFTLSSSLGKTIAAPIGIAAGTLQGATGIGSPVGATFIHAMRLHRTAHVFALSAMFLLFAVVQIPALAIAGVLSLPITLEGLFATLPAVLMLPVGAWLASYLSQRTFDRLILALLIVIALQLVWKNLA
jgi:uncharacterized protein